MGLDLSERQMLEINKNREGQQSFDREAVCAILSTAERQHSKAHLCLRI